jgi:PAS domain S-box-containing protein
MLEGNLEMFKEKFNKSIRFKFLSIISVILFVSTLVLSLVISINEERMLKDSLMTTGQSFASYISKLCRDPLVMKDSFQLDAVVIDANVDENIAYAIIRDEQGAALTTQYASVNYHVPRLNAVLSQLPRDSELQDIIDAIKKVDPVIEVSTSVVMGAKTVGSVTVGMSEHNIHQQIIRTVLFAIALNVALGFVLGAVLFVASRKIVFDPLIELAHASSLLAKGDLSVEVKVETTGEVKTLVDSFNEMVNNLEKVTVSKDYVDNIINSMINSLIVVSPDGEVIRVNNATCTLLGYEEGELIGRPFETVFGGESSRKVSLMKTILADGHIANIEESYRAKNGRDVPVLLSASVMHDNINLIRGIVYAAQDITERKRADTELRKAYQQLRAADEQMRAQYNSLVESEQSLRESEERYRYLVKHAPTGIYEVDVTARRFLSVNDVMCQYTGYTREEFLAMDSLQLLTEESTKTFIQRHPKVLAGEPFSDGVEYQIKRKDGSEFWALLNSRHSYEPDNRIIATVIAHDITERKRAEEAVIESEKAARQLAKENELIAEIGKIISSTLDIDKVYERFAEEVRKFIPIDRISINLINPKDNTGTNAYISGTELPRRKKGDYYPIAFTVTEGVSRARGSVLVNEENYKYSLDRFPGSAEIFQGGIRSLMATPLISKDKVIGAVHYGSAKPNLYSDKELKLAERVSYQIAGAIANAQLYRERKQAEEERRSMEERLQRAEKMEALGTLAGGVAHDLNNVLGVLVGYSELLLQSVPQESPFQRHAMQIFKGGQRAAAIIQDLLTLTRRGVLVSDTLNLNRVVSDFLQMPEFEAIKSHHPGVKFETSLDAELLNVKGSSTHLSKTVMNLLSNAAESISGSGEVLIRTENRYVDRPIHGYDTTQEGEYAVLTVSDTGSGISSSDIGRIFEPFYTKKVMGRSGTGLGLAVVWGTVKDHDGYIDVQSTVGEGTVFTLYFPVTRGDLTKAEQVVPQSTYLGRGEHVLVVDDVEGQRLLASAMLDSLGYKVSSVTSGEEAVEFVKKQPVDLLILDMIMDPGMDGLDTYRSILDIRPQQKAIIVSGFSESDRVIAAHVLGAGAYVRKPYVIEKLGLAVKKELERK